MDLEILKKSVVKRYGPGQLISFNDKPLPVPAICSTGLRGLDYALGIGGYPKERIIEIYGPEASGKTTLALCASADVQSRGGYVAFIDVEHALDPNYASNVVGVDINNNFLLSQPDYGEQAIDIAAHILSSQKATPDQPLLIIIDSVDALVPLKELNGDFDPNADGDDKKKGGGMGLRARLMSNACRQLNQGLKGSNCTIIFINQIRMKIGVMFGSPETTSGGNALKFYASVRLDVRNIGQHKQGELVIGNKFRVKIKKNKVAPPFREYEGLNIHGKGFQKDWDLFNTLLEMGHIKRDKSWMSIAGVDKKFQGYDGFVEFIKEQDNFDYANKLVGTMVLTG